MEARRTWHTDPFGDRLVPWDLFFNDLSHTALAAFGIAWAVDFSTDDVVAAGFDLAGFSPVTSTLAGCVEHRAGAKGSENKGDEGGDNDEVFHGLHLGG